MRPLTVSTAAICRLLLLLLYTITISNPLMSRNVDACAVRPSVPLSSCLAYRFRRKSSVASRCHSVVPLHRTDRKTNRLLTYLLTYLGRAKRSHHGTVWLHRHPESFYLAFPTHPVSKHCFAVSKKNGFVSERSSVLSVASARMPVNEMEKTVWNYNGFCIGFINRVIL